MKNKLEKKNMTRFDYKARRLGIFGCAMIVLSLAVILPVAAHVSDTNNAIEQRITNLNEQIEQNQSQFEIENK